MSEERGAYHLHVEDADRELVGVERVGDVLRQLIDERGWPLNVGHPPADGHSARGDNSGRYPDG